MRTAVYWSSPSGSKKTPTPPTWPTPCAMVFARYLSSPARSTSMPMPPAPEPWTTVRRMTSEVVQRLSKPKTPGALYAPYVSAPPASMASVTP
jgi:hypothetical protein